MHSSRPRTDEDSSAWQLTERFVKVEIMPRYTETVNFEEEVERLDEELDTLAEERCTLEREIEQKGLDHSNPRVEREKEQLAQKASRLEQMFAGAQWALNPDDGRDPIEEITLRSLTASEYAKVADEYEKGRSNRPTDGPQNNARRIIFAQAYIQEAPFIESEMAESDRIEAVRQCAPQFVFWLDRRGDGLTTPEVEGNGYGQRVAEKM